MSAPFVRLGREWNPKRGTYGKVRAYEGQAHTLVFGATGTSKSVAFMVPQLLCRENDKRSFIVIEPNGQACAITARHRRQVCGDENVHVIDPSGVLERKGRLDLKSSGWNRLLSPDPDHRDFIKLCVGIGDALVPVERNEHQKYFPYGARGLATAACIAEILTARREKRTPSLGNVRKAITQSPKALKATINEWLKLDNFALSTSCAKFLGEGDDLESIKSTLENELAFLINDALRADISSDTRLDFGNACHVPSTYYQVVALDELEANRNYLRLFLQSTLQDIYRAGPGPVGVTIIIEEGYVLRHMAALVEALSIARNFGVNIIVVFQTMGQLKGLYGDDWSLFVSGAVVALPPGTGDMDTAKWISERAGQVIVPVLSASDPNSPTDLWPRPSWGPQTRARIPIEKIFAMPPWHAIAFLPGRDAPLPIRCDGYFAVPELNKRADANPYYLGKPAAAPASRRRGLRAWLLGSAACLTSLALLPGIARAPTPPSSLRVERPTHAASMPAQVAHPPPVARTKRGKKP